ncbi:MAG: SDR family NAD(P)-dependent oxidoreductase [Deinococcota bacterium]
MASSDLLKGKTALITGASGIAAATAKRFCEEGAQVAVIDRSVEALQTLQQDLAEVVALEGDLTDSSTCSRLVSEAQTQLGHLDIAVNVVGISARRFGDGLVHEATDEGFDTAMTVNVKTTFMVCREVVKHMLARGSGQGGGSIINTSSVVAYAPNAEHFGTHAYAASKAAIIGLSNAMASSYAAHGIRVNTLAPGLIRTPMSKRAQADEGVLAYMKRRQPLTGDLGEPEDVAGAAVFLASDLSRFVTGEVLEVAGGWRVSG